MADQNELTYSFPITLSCKDQSMWESGVTDAIAADTGESLYVTIPDNPPAVDGSVDLPILGTFGCKGSLDIKGTKLGLRLKAYATAGSVDVSCPVGVGFEYPQYVTANDVFRIDTGYKLDQTAVMNTYSPDVGIKLFGHAEGRFAADVLVKAFGASLLDFSMHAGKSADDPSFSAQDSNGQDPLIYNLDIQALAEVLASQLTLAYPSAESPVVQGSFNFPVINTTGTRNDSFQALESDGSDSLLQVELSITELIVFILQKIGIELPDIQKELSFPADNDKSGSNASTDQKDKSRAFAVSLSYEILNLWLRGELGFYQTFSFTPALQFSIVATDGLQSPTPVTAYRTCDAAGNLSDPVDMSPSTITKLPVGTSLYFRMPASGAVQIRPTVYPGASFTNTTGAYLQGSVGFDPLVLSVEGSVAGISLPSFDFAPLNTSKDFPYRIPFKTLRPTLALDTTAGVAAPAFTVPVNNPPMARLAGFTGGPVYPYNNPEPRNAQPQGALALRIQSDGPAWPDNALDRGPLQQLWVYLDGTLLDALNTSNPQEVQVNIPPGLLTPGHHTLSARVQWNAQNVKPDQPIEMNSAIDFDVPHFVPQLFELHLGGGEDDSQPVVDMAVVPENQNDNGRQTLFYVQGSGFAPDTRVVFVNQTTGKASHFTRAKDCSFDPEKIFFRVPNQVLYAPGVLSVYAVNRCSPGQTPTVAGKDGLYSNALPLNLLSATPSVVGTDPGALVLDGPDCWVILNGACFRRGCSVQLGGNTLQTRYISDTQVSARVPAALLDHSRYGSYRGLTTTIGTTAAPPPQNTLLVVNPQVKTHDGIVTGGYSQECWISLQPQPPAITAVSPTQLAYGGAATTITLTGRNFLPGSMLLVGQKQSLLSPLPGGTGQQLSFTLPPALLFEHGVMEAILINPYFPTAATGTRVGLRVEAPVYQCSATAAPTLILAANLDPASPLPGVDTLVAQGKVLCGLNHMTGQVYAFDGVARWSQVGDGCLDLVANEGALFKLDALGQVWKGDTSGSRFYMLPANVKLAQVLPTGNDLYALDGSRVPYRLTGTSWTPIAPILNAIQYATTRDDLYCISAGSSVYRYNRTSNAWQLLSTGPARRLITSPSFSALLIETTAGQVVRFDAVKGTWTGVTAAAKQYAVGPSTLYALQPNGDVLSFDLSGSGAASRRVARQADGVCATGIGVYAFLKP